MRVITRHPAGALAVVTCLVAAGLVSAIMALSAHARHAAALAASISTARGTNAAMTHSPQLLKQLAGSATATGAAAPDTGTSAPGPQGVDVASFQHPNGATIDWAQVAAAGYKFAAVKATEGNYYVNPYFGTDIGAASSNGLYPIAYHFAIPNVSTGTQQADYLLSAAHGTVNGTTPQLELDIEYDPYATSDGTNECYGLTAAQMMSWIAAFSNEIRLKAGQAPIIYTTADWWNTCTGDSTATHAYQLWIASYGTTPAVPAAWSTWTFWQYTSTGSVPGISGNVDVSYFSTAAGTLANPGPQAAAVGAPVWLQLGALVGAAPFSATGLPPGTSLNTGTGLVSGWLTKTGTYTVSVAGSATGTAPLATTGTTITFTWTVSAAPNSGPTGPVVLDYHGKCLDDPGYQTANGTRVDIWSCNGGGNQRWTMAQDGTIRVYGKCLDVYHAGTANGTPVDLYSCTGGANQRWQIGTDGRLISAASRTCLDDPGYQTANGTRVDIWSCGTGTNQRWTTPAGPIVSQIAPLCVDDPAYQTADGTRIDVWSCNGGSNQRWTVWPDGSVRLSGKCLDVSGSGTAAGTAVDLYSCNGTGAQQWRPNASGTLLNPQSGRCLADPGDNAQSGTRLVISDCGAAAGENWRIR